MEEEREIESSVQAEGPKRASTNKIIIIAVIGIVLVLVMLFVPFVPAKETYLQSYMDTEWETQEYERIAKYAVDRSEWVSGFWLQGCYCDIYVKVRNTDVEGGTFKVRVEIEDITHVVFSKTKTQYIGPGNSYQFHFYYDTDCGTDYVWSKYVTAPTIIDTHLVEIDVEKQREAERTVYKSVYQILTGG